jgi:hypothetical protein
MATQPAAKNKRLSQGDRDALYSFARKCVTETQDSTALDTAYDAAAQVVHDLLVEKYPQNDMKVLARYDAAAEDNCVYVSNGGFGDYDQFCFRDGDKRIPLRPSARGYNRRTPFMLEGAQAETYSTYKKTKAAFEGGIKQRYADYKALIFAAKTFNEVAEIWPQAEQLRMAIVGTSSSLVVLSNDVVERIKADPAHKLAEAA